MLPLDKFLYLPTYNIQELEKSIARTFGRSDKCTWIFWWHQGEDETFAAGSPLEAHGRFSKGRAVEVVVALAFLGPAFRSGNLMHVACHANIFSFISPLSFSRQFILNKRLPLLVYSCVVRQEPCIIMDDFFFCVQLVLRPSSYAETVSALTVTDTAMACKIATMDPMNTTAVSIVFTSERCSPALITVICMRMQFGLVIVVLRIGALRL
ncbi:hypothetical protein ALC62_15576 [Cyphomyrmex costatus]|uniref:Uncharacterized protein n=1 Tax=Cyphomyrmex costatus TaxID=456900 RepID=A0A195BYZ8_9HYME|nr:hypothetical protein ALC62_15576 [Cyphomyrmex costatus]